MKRGSIYSKNILARNHLPLNNFRANIPRTFASTMGSFSSPSFTGNNKQYRGVLPFVVGVSLGSGIAYQAKNQIHADDSSDPITLDSILKDINNNDLKSLQNKLFDNPNKEKYQQILLDNFFEIEPRVSLHYFLNHEEHSLYKVIVNHLIETKNKPDTFVQNLLSTLTNNLKFSGNNFCTKIICELIENHPTITEPKLSFLKNLDLLEIKNNYPEITSQAIKHMSSIALLIKDKIMEIFLSKRNKFTLIECIEWYSKSNATYTQEFATKLAKDLEASNDYFNKWYNLDVLKAISSAAPCNDDLAQVLKKQRDEKSFFTINLLQRLLYAQSCKNSCVTENLHQTSTISHLQHYAHKDKDGALSGGVLKKFIDEEDLSFLVRDIMNKEKDLQDTHYTFIHGQSNELLLAEHLHTFFQYHDKSYNTLEFLDLRVRKHDQNQEKEQEYHMQLIEHGCANMQDKKSVLFMNKSLFGNLSTRFDENSAWFIASNSSTISIPLSLKKVFEIHGCSNLYEKYQSRLEKLQSELTSEITRFGTCILVAIPKSTIHEQVFVAWPTGPKTTIRIKKDGRIITTDKVDMILETLEKEPKNVDNFDKLIFCLPMTTYRGLNPKSDIKFFPFTAANPSRLDVWYTQVHNLFDEIAADIKEQKS